MAGHAEVTAVDRHERVMLLLTLVLALAGVLYAAVAQEGRLSCREAKAELDRAVESVKNSCGY